MENNNIAKIEEIKELFYAAEQEFMGIKDNTVLFKCGSPHFGEKGTINKDGESEGHDTFPWVKRHVGRILSENNFEDLEFTAEQWKEYEESFPKKTGDEIKELLRNKIESYTGNKEIYFLNKSNIIAKEDDHYKLLAIQTNFFKGMVTGNLFKLNVYSTDEINGEGTTDLFIPLFILMNVRKQTKDEIEITPDETPQEVLNTVKYSQIFSKDREAFDEIVLEKGEDN